MNLKGYGSLGIEGSSAGAGMASTVLEISSLVCSVNELLSLGVTAHDQQDSTRIDVKKRDLR
jgi:hypothetical protein